MSAFAQHEIDQAYAKRVHELLSELNEVLRRAHNSGLEIQSEIMEHRALSTGQTLPIFNVTLMRPVKVDHSPTKAKLDENLLVPRRR